MTFRLEATLAARDFRVSLNVGPGETVAVLGPNGAGKSTLLDIIAGLLRPDAGSATVGGRQLFDLDAGASLWTAPHRRGTALLAQDALLFPHLSALENVAFGPRSAGIPPARARDTARHWLHEVGAAELADRRPGQLSGGQAQRVAVARALAAGPELLLLDEPMAALDIHAAPLLRRLLKRVLTGRRAVIVTHDVLDALMLADRVIVLERGRISEDGPTREVLQRPRSSFAAGLSGLNLLTGTITAAGLRTDEGLDVAGQHDDAGDAGDAGDSGDSGAGDSGAGDAGAGDDGGAGVAVFAPSAVSVFLEIPRGSPRNAFPVTVTELEPHGDQIRVRAGGLAADITPAAAADLGLVPGTRVFFVVKAAAVAVYPA